MSKFRIPEQPRAVEVNGDVHIDLNSLNQWHSDMDATHKQFEQMVQGAEMDPDEITRRLFNALRRENK